MLDVLPDVTPDRVSTDDVVDPLAVLVEVVVEVVVLVTVLDTVLGAALEGRLARISQLPPATNEAAARHHPAVRLLWMSLEKDGLPNCWTLNAM